MEGKRKNPGEEGRSERMKRWFVCTAKEEEKNYVAQRCTYNNALERGRKKYVQLRRGGPNAPGAKKIVEKKGE